MDKETIGFIGLGQMGAGMAGTLARAGVPLVVHDVNTEAADAIAAAGAVVATEPAAVARQASRLFLCLPTDVEAAQVLFGAGGVAAATRPIDIVDTTTMHRDAAVGLAARARETGLGYCDCPVSGLPARAESGTLTMMFGGTGVAFAAARPYLDLMGAFVVHCGGVGMGQLMKAVNNIVYDVNIAAIAEILPLAVKAGLRPETVAAVLTTASARSFASEHFVPRILDGRFAGDFSLAAAHKDLANIRTVATRLGASLPVIEAMMSTYQAAIDMGFGDEPKSAMVKVYEARLGQRVRRGGGDEPAA